MVDKRGPATWGENKGRRWQHMGLETVVGIIDRHCAQRGINVERSTVVAVSPAVSVVAVTVVRAVAVMR